MADQSPKRPDAAKNSALPDKPAPDKSEIEDAALRDVTGGVSDISIGKQTDVASPKL